MTAETYTGPNPDFDLSDAIPAGMVKLDIDALRDQAQESASEQADSDCIYTSKNLDHITTFQNHADAYDAEELISGKTYAANEWSEAVDDWARAIMSCVMRAAANRAVDEVEEAADDLCDKLRAHPAIGEHYPEPDGLTVTRECPHGWAVHDSEDPEGVHTWSPANLEGCWALAVKVEGLWLSFTWTPEAVV